jgi:cytidylate kinase
MWKNISFEQCLSHINRQAKSGSTANPSITISRMCGAGGRTVASKLVEYLQPHTPAGRSWTIFDKKLIEQVLADHHLSKRLVEFLPEDHKSLVAELIENLRGLHPPTSTIVEQTVETIWNLAAAGQVILVGRAANVITEKLDNVYHVRLVGSLENRIARVEEVYELGRNDAREFILAQDAAKRRYMKEYFGREIDDPTLYHLIINTDKISYEQAARLIGEAVVNRFKLAANAGFKAG